jgi:beta-glucosidase
MAFAAGVKTLMVNSGELNGEPVHGSKYYLDELLRKKLGFEGVILTDIKDIMKMVEMHGAFATEKEATVAAINAGIDMSMACNSYEFTNIMKELVQEGKITEARINESVKRILLFKKELGLFENPYPSKARLSKIGSKEHKKAAIKAAEESIILMKNDSLLPLTDGKKILLAGFAANSKKLLNGAWTFEWMGAEENKQPANMHTIYTALQEKMPKSKITLADSSTLYNSTKLAQAAQQADVVVLTIGENPYSEFKGNSNDISLSAEQQAQIKAIQATGKPLVLIILAGRPVILTPFLEKTKAILFAGSPGVGGADAIAHILNGTVNPSAKLSFTYPDAVGHIVPYYVKQSEYHHDRTGKFKPRFPFGFGMSYTEYDYANLTLSDTIITDLNTSITATVQVRNSGKMDGKESVLWFLQDEVGTITRPIKQLKGVEKKLIKAGETQTFTFTIKPQEMFAYPDREGNTIIEDGYFKLTVGNLSARIKLDRAATAAKGK